MSTHGENGALHGHEQKRSTYPTTARTELQVSLGRPDEAVPRGPAATSGQKAEERFPEAGAGAGVGTDCSRGCPRGEGEH